MAHTKTIIQARALLGLFFALFAETFAWLAFPAEGNGCLGEVALPKRAGLYLITPRLR